MDCGHNLQHQDISINRYLQIFKMQTSVKQTLFACLDQLYFASSYDVVPDNESIDQSFFHAMVETKVLSIKYSRGFLRVTKNIDSSSANIFLLLEPSIIQILKEDTNCTVVFFW
jgi:hypothetical protein